VIVVKEGTLAAIIGLRRAVATETSIVLPRGPPPLNEKNVAVREPSIIVLHTGVRLIITSLLNLHDSVTTSVYLIHQVDPTTSIVIGSIRNSLLFEWGHEAPERI
jgi:hypothetical protein